MLNATCRSIQFEGSSDFNKAVDDVRNNVPGAQEVLAKKVSEIVKEKGINLEDEEPEQKSEFFVFKIITIGTAVLLGLLHLLNWNKTVDRTL